MTTPALQERALAAAVKLFNRKHWTQQRLELLPRENAPLYATDRLWTYHDHSFIEEERFGRAYRRAAKAGGFDYGIPWRVHTILWAAEQAARVEGAFVECGTGRGFMASAICEYLSWSDRPFYLYDTFLPTVPDHTGSQDGGPTCPFYAKGPERVAENFAEWPGVQLVVGRIPETLLDTGPVAFLHVDLNHAGAEEAVVHHFWPKLTRGALVVFDDYAYLGYKAQHESADNLARQLGFQILTLPTGQGLVLR